jgi:hypothetical protein
VVGVSQCHPTRKKKKKKTVDSKPLYKSDSNVETSYFRVDGDGHNMPSRYKIVVVDENFQAFR